MKIVLTICLAVIGFASPGQTNPPVTLPDPPATQLQVTTNYVKAHRSFRRVNGKLYNIEKSVLWNEIKGICTKVLTNGTVVRTVVDKSERYVLPPSDSGTSISNVLLGAKPSVPTVQTRRWQEEGPVILLVNYDGPETATGNILRAKAIKTGTYTYEGDVIEMWDCGTPNIVPVIVTNSPAMSPDTNRPPSKATSGK